MQEKDAWSSRRRANDGHVDGGRIRCGRRRRGWTVVVGPEIRYEQTK